MWVGRRKGQTQMRGAKKQRDADGVKIEVKGAGVQKAEQKRNPQRKSARAAF